MATDFQRVEAVAITQEGENLHIIPVNFKEGVAENTTEEAVDYPRVEARAITKEGEDLHIIPVNLGSDGPVGRWMIPPLAAERNQIRRNRMKTV